MPRGSDRRTWFIAGGCLLVIVIALLSPRHKPKPDPDERAVSTNASRQATAAYSLSTERARRVARTSISTLPPTAEEIVTNKVNQFTRNRRELVHAIARKFEVEVPDEVERFFEAVAAGRWDEVEGLAKALRENLRRSDDLVKLWPPIHETWGAIQEALDWPAQKLLDYGNEILGSLRPGMVFVGGTDPGRWIPTLMSKNPDISFAMEESFPLKSTYSDAAPIGPVVELRVNDGQNALTTERAAQSLDYWRVTAQQLLADPEASASSATLNSYSKLAVGQANLFAERNFTAEAEQTYRVATEIQPANVEAVCGLSEILTRTGRSGEASQILDDFMRKYPNQRGSLEELRKMHAVPVPVTPAPPPPSIP